MAKETKKVTRKSPKVSKRHVKKEQVPSKDISYSVNLPQDSKRRVSFLIGLIVVLGVLYLARGLFVAAVVNGNPISRLSIIREVEKQSGQQALQNAVTRVLIEDEAKKRKITVSQQEVDAEMKKIDDSLKQSGQNLADILKARNLDKKDVEKQIKTQKMVEKMVAGKAEVTDQEIAEYLEKNKDVLPQENDQEKLNQMVKDQLKQQKTDEEFNKLITELQKKAKIYYFVKY
jgi:foldase protein PrsA